MPDPENRVPLIVGIVVCVGLLGFLAVAYVGMNESPSLQSPWGTLPVSQELPPENATGSMRE